MHGSFYWNPLKIQALPGRVKIRASRRIAVRHDSLGSKGVFINQGRSQYKKMLAVLCTGIFLAAIDQTVVVTVLPRIIDDLEGGFNPSAVERAGFWIITSYLFGFTVVLGCGGYPNRPALVASRSTSPEF